MTVDRVGQIRARLNAATADARRLHRTANGCDNVSRHVQASLIRGIARRDEERAADLAWLLDVYERVERVRADWAAGLNLSADIDAPFTKRAAERIVGQLDVALRRES